MKKDNYKYTNEKEIKDKCIIIIKNKKIDFNYFYKFNEKGNFKLEYSFKKIYKLKSICSLNVIL